MTKGLNFFCSHCGTASITQISLGYSMKGIRSMNFRCIDHKAPKSVSESFSMFAKPKSPTRPTKCKLIKLSSYPPAVVFAFHWGYLAVESCVWRFTRCLFMILLSKYELTKHEKRHFVWMSLKSICLFGFNLNKFWKLFSEQM